MSIHINVQRIHTATIDTHLYGTFATASIWMPGQNVNLFFPTYQQARLVAAALRNDEQNLRWFLNNPPRDDEAFDEAEGEQG